MAALRKLADADPNPGSVTQSSNTNNGGVTTDRVEVTAEYGTIPRFSVRNGAEWSIGMNEGNPEAMTGLNAPWKGAELSKKLSDGTLYVNAYTDIKAPTTRTVTVTGNAGTVTVPVGGQISISGLSAPTISLGGRFSGAGSFNGQQGSLSCSGSCRIEDGRATSGTWSFTPDRPPGAQDVPGSAAGVGDFRSISTSRAEGTFNGRAGSFRCISSSCGRRTSNGRLTGLSGDWIFIPGGGTTTETDKDTDYLAGGVWLYVPDAASSTDDYEFGTFVGGNDPFTQANIMALTGTATYRGDATGVYSARAASATTIAYFDGDARLTADFGAAGSLGTISGSITNFEAGGESVSGSLTLGQAAIGSANSGFFKGAVTGSDDERRYTGKWGGQFFGNGAASTDQPGSVAGTFGGRSTDNAVNYVGAFGAFKQ